MNQAVVPFGTPRGPGRPKGAGDRGIARKTSIFRAAVTEDDIVDLANRLMEIIRDPNSTPSDVAKIAPIILRYTVNTADVDVLMEAQQAKLSPEQMDALRSLITIEGKGRDTAVDITKKY